MQCAQAYEDAILWEGADSVAGIIVEPVITGGGMIVPPDPYLARLRKICDKHDVLLIVDEVICGFGRSGEKFGHQNFGVRPDIVTMAKGLTSAYSPLSATAVSAEMYESFKESGADNHFRHVNTFGGNPVSCAVALKNIEIIERENLVSRSAYIGKELFSRIKPLESHQYVGELRILVRLSVSSWWRINEQRSQHLLQELLLLLRSASKKDCSLAKMEIQCRDL